MPDQIQHLYNKHIRIQMHWTLASFLSAFFGALYIIMFSHLVKHENQSRNLLHYMLYLYIISFICIGCILSTQQYRRVLKLTYKESCYVLGMSVCFVLSTYYFATAFRVAPNPAFVTTIANSNMLIVLVLSLLAGAVLHWQAVIGVLLTFFGLCIVIYFGERTTLTSM